MTLVHVVTGFLGSGKTTLVARLLRDPALADTAVIVNEFGEAGLDHALLEAVDGEVVLLARGCVCCALNGSLSGTLESLAERRGRGELPPFRRVVVETTGLADPAPVLQAVLDGAAVLRGYRLGRVVATVDAVTGEASLDRHAEAVRQAAVADVLLLTKTDLAGPAAQLQARLRALNPRAPVRPVLHGEAPAALLLDDPAGEGHRVAPGETGRRGRGTLFVADAGHAARIASTVLPLPEPVAFARLADWLGTLAAEHGPALLRVKGLVGIEAQVRPLLVQGVQHVFHPPRLLERWPDGMLSGLTFILDGLHPAAIHAGAEQAGLAGRGAA